MKKRKDFLIFGSPRIEEDEIEEVWTKDQPDKFNLVFNNKTVRIYKLNR